MRLVELPLGALGKEGLMHQATCGLNTPHVDRQRQLCAPSPAFASLLTKSSKIVSVKSPLP
jgi:hypothetical protein